MADPWDAFKTAAPVNQPAGAEPAALPPSAPSVSSEDPWAAFASTTGPAVSAAPAPTAVKDPWAAFASTASSTSPFQSSEQEPPRRAPQAETHTGDPWHSLSNFWDWTNTPVVDQDWFKKWTGWDVEHTIAGIQNPWIRGAAKFGVGMLSPLQLGLMAGTMGSGFLFESGGAAALKAAGMGAEEIADVTRGAEIFGKALNVGKTAPEALAAVQEAGLSTKLVTDGLQALSKSGLSSDALLSNGLIRRAASSGLRRAMSDVPGGLAYAENIGKWAQVALDGTFSAQMAYGGAQYSSALFDAIKDGDWDRAKELSVQLAATGVFAVGTGRAALHEAGYDSTPGAKFGKSDIMSESFQQVKHEYDVREANMIEIGVNAKNFIADFRKKYPDMQNEADLTEAHIKSIIGMTTEEASKRAEAWDESVRLHNLLADAAGKPERKLPLRSDLAAQSRVVEIPRTPDAAVDFIKGTKENFALLSAEVKDRTPAENATQTAALLDELKARGFAPMEADGVFEGGAEKAFFVPGIKPEDAAELGRKYGQQSVVTREGLHELKDDIVRPADNKGLIVGDAARALPNHTVLRAPDGTATIFSVPLDFERELKPGYSKWTSGQNITIDDLVKQQGTTDDISKAAFIAPDGRLIDWGTRTRHPQILGGTEFDKGDYINSMNLIRHRDHGPNQGSTFTLPRGGITETQAEQLRKLAGRPVMRLESADPVNGKSVRLESPSVEDINKAIDNLVGTRLFTPDELAGRVPELEQTRSALRDQFRKQYPTMPPEQYEGAIGMMEVYAKIFDMPVRNLADLVADWRVGKEEVPTAEALRKEEPLAQRGTGAPSGSIVDLRKRLATFELTGEPRGRVTKESVADTLNRGTLRDLDPLTLSSSDRETMTGRAARIGEHELQYHVAEGSAGRKWYTDEMKAAQRNLTEVHPEFERPKTWGFFTTISSALSGGKNPEMELRAAERIYAALKDTGEMPTLQPNGKPWGTTGESRHIAKLQRLLDANGGDMEKTFDWIMTKHPREEVVAASGARSKEGQEHIPEGEAYGAYALGPKMGPYVLNKNGVLSELTMDRWATRTWKRWMGTLVDPETGKVRDMPTQAEREMMKASLERIGEKNKISVAEAQAMLWYAEQDVYSHMGYDNKARSYGESARTIADEVRSGKDVPINPEDETGGPAPQDVGLPPHGGRGEAARPTSFEFGENVPAGEGPLEQRRGAAAQRMTRVAKREFDTMAPEEVGDNRNARFVLADGSVVVDSNYHHEISDRLLGGKDNYKGDAVSRAVDAGLVRIAWNSRNGIAFEVGQEPTPAQMRAIATLTKGKPMDADLTDASGYASKHITSVKSLGDLQRAIDEHLAPSLAQEPKGELLGTTKFLKDGRAVVTAMKGGNFSTFVHELGHVIFENLHDLSPRLAKMAEDIYGKPGESNAISPRGWTRDQHEAFARDVETYHLKGTLPQGAEAALPLMQKVKGWMRDIYQRMRNSPVRENVLTPEKERFFDEMYGSVDPRQQARNHWTEKPAIQEMAKQQLMKKHYSDEEIEKWLHAYNPNNWRPETTEMAKDIKTILDRNLQNAMVNGVLKQGTADYLPRIYKGFGDNPLSNRLKTEVNAGNFATNSPMARHRIFQSEVEAMLHGYKLADYDPAQLAAWNTISMERAAANRKLIQNLLDKGYRGSDGRPWVALDGKADVVHDENGENPAILASAHATRDIRIADKQVKTMQESGDLARYLNDGTVVKYGKASDGTDHYAWNTDGFKTIPHSSFTKWDFKANGPDGTPVIMKSDIKVHPEIYDYIMRRMGLEKVPEGPVKKAVMAAGREAKGILLFGSPFHLFQEGLRAVMTGISPLGVEKFDVDNPLHRLAAEKGVWEGRDVKDIEQFSDGLVGHSKVIGAIPGLRNLQSWMQNFLFDKYIPGLKLRAFERLVDAYRKANPEWTDDKVAEVAAKDTNFRFGGLPYKRMGRAAATQDWARILALAPDWMESELRFMAHVLGPEGNVARRDLALTAAGLWAAARVLNYLSTGNMHNEAPFGVAVKDDEGREKIYSMRSIPTDIFHAVSDPAGFLKGRTSPLVRTGYEVYSGRDEYGRKLPSHAIAYDVLRNVAPIWAQTAAKAASGELNVSPGEQATRAMGLMTRTYKTGAEAKAAELASNRSESGPVDKDALRHHQSILEMQDRLRANQMTPQDLSQLAAQGQITQKEVKSIWKTVKETQGMDPEAARLYMRSSRLSMPDFLQVWDLATNKEKAALTQLMLKKRKQYYKKVFTDMPPAQRLTDPTYRRLQQMFPQEPAI